MPRVLVTSWPHLTAAAQQKALRPLKSLVTPWILYIVFKDMNLKTLLFFLAILIIGITLLKLNTTGPELSEKSPDQKPTLKTQIPSPQKLSPDSAQADRTTKKEEEIHPSASASLRNWLDQNANSMTSFSESDRVKLEQQVQKLSHEDFKSLRIFALSINAPANVRVLSVYLLGESARGVNELKKFLSEDVNIIENAPAHSVDETANGREKALRVMAIEQLIKNSPTPQMAYQRLAGMIPEISDPWLKSFAQRRLADIPH